MRLKIQCTNVVRSALPVSIWQYTQAVGPGGNTLCRQNSAEIDFWQTGWLARRRGSEKHPLEGSRRRRRAGSPLAAKTGRSRIQKCCVTETANLNFKLKNDEPDDEPVNLRQS